MRRKNKIFKTFRYQNTRISYSDIGEGKTIILVHGLASASYTWRYVAHSLSKSYRVISPDLKGFGLSDKPQDDNYTIDDHVNILFEFIQHLKIKDITLVGHSFGGIVNLLTCIKMMGILEVVNPIRHLVFLDSIADQKDIPFLINLVRVPILNYLLINKFTMGILVNPFLMRQYLRRVFYNPQKINDIMVNIYTAYLKKPGAIYALRKTIEGILPKSIAKLNEDIGRIKIPVLVIWGENDRVIPIKAGRAFTEKMPHAKWLEIAECGHNPHEEKPKVVVKSILDFLNRDKE